MVRAHRARTATEVAWRLLAPALALILIFSGTAVDPQPALARGGSDVTSTLRQRQLQAEATMLRADKQVKRLLKQRRHRAGSLRAAKRQLDRAIARRDASARRSGRAGARLHDHEWTLARTVRVRPNPTGTQVVDKPVLRKQIRTLENKKQRLEAKTHKLRRQVDRARKTKQLQQKTAGAARIKARRMAREHAEDKLGTAIKQMVELSQERASGTLGPSSVKGFKRPAKGRVSQGYGCTGFRTNRSRGGCAHFHDGIDIAAKRGTTVRASADGYVAYVGRNPWDVGSRAYVVIIGHAGGYESVYGHLQPRRKVRAGQRVERGDVIGSVGNTGRSTGPHVHWAISRGFHSLNPRRAGR